MEDTFDTDDMPIDLRFAAIIALLSSCTLRGVTVGKLAALRAHLEAAALSSDESIDPRLRCVLEDTLAEWLTIECHRKSVPCDCRPLPDANPPSLH